MIIDGEEYVSTKEASKMLDDLFTFKTVRSIAEKQGWKTRRVGRYYYFRQTDVGYPDWSLSKWQLVMLQYFYMVATKFQNEEMFAEVTSLIDANLYSGAARFIRNTGFSYLVSGSLFLSAGGGRLTSVRGAVEDVAGLLLTVSDNDTVEDNCPTFVLGTVEDKDDLLLVVADNSTVAGSWVNIDDVLLEIGNTTIIDQAAITKLASQLWSRREELKAQQPRPEPASTRTADTQKENNGSH